jgi:hypothetical protein
VLAPSTLVARSATAQRATPASGVGATPAASLLPTSGDSVATPPAPGAGTEVRRPPPSWWTPIASAVAPGAGQALLGQNRWVAYAAAEAYSLARYATDARDGRRQRDRYRALARDVARAGFGGELPDGSFDYYERMEHYARSGVYDQGRGGPLLPEGDTTTSNGALWLLARQTYWEDPTIVPPFESAAYRSAIDLYTRRAVRPDYLWSWSGAPLEQDAFRTDISRSNAAFRRSVEDLGAVLANHVLSTVDAYVSPPKGTERRRLRGRGRRSLRPFRASLGVADRDPRAAAWTRMSPHAGSPYAVNDDA